MYRSREKKCCRKEGNAVLQMARKHMKERNRDKEGEVKLKRMNKT